MKKTEIIVAWFNGYEYEDSGYVFGSYVEAMEALKQEAREYSATPIKMYYKLYKGRENFERDICGFKFYTF